MDNCTVNMNGWIKDENFVMGCNDEFIDYYELIYVSYHDDLENKEPLLNIAESKCCVFVENKICRNC